MELWGLCHDCWVCIWACICGVENVVQVGKEGSENVCQEEDEGINVGGKRESINLEDSMYIRNKKSILNIQRSTAT